MPKQREQQKKEPSLMCSCVRKWSRNVDHSHQTLFHTHSERARERESGKCSSDSELLTMKCSFSLLFFYSSVGSQRNSFVKSPCRRPKRIRVRHLNSHGIWPLERRDQNVNKCQRTILSAYCLTDTYTHTRGPAGSTG